MCLNFKTIFILMLSIITVSNYAYSQDNKSEKKIARQQNRAIKQAFKKLSKKISKDKELREEFSSLLSQCPEFDFVCQDRLQRMVEVSVQGTDLEKNASGLTFGICHPDKKSNSFHKVVYSEKSYNCKLSSHGEVYDKTVEKKLFGPGILWDKQSIVLMCTGPAYGTTTYGYSAIAGAGFGISIGTVFGKVGLCLAVGSGKSLGFYIGGATYKFEKI